MNERVGEGGERWEEREREREQLENVYFSLKNGLVLASYWAFCGMDIPPCTHTRIDTSTNTCKETNTHTHTHTQTNTQGKV